MKLIVAGHQPNYLPWLGFFDKMKKSDVFIIEDNVQYERQGYQNRTRIKTFHGIIWLTVPIVHTGKSQPINDVTIANDSEQDWMNRHYLTLRFHYRRAPYWEKYGPFFESTYTQKWTKLIDLNMHIIRGLMDFLNIKKTLVMASSLNVSGRKSDLVLAKCKALGGTVQLSGIGAHNYLDVRSFEENGIKVIFQDFKHPVYFQGDNNFIPNLSSVDYLFYNGGDKGITEFTSQDDSHGR